MIKSYDAEVGASCKTQMGVPASLKKQRVV